MGTVSKKPFYTKQARQFVNRVRANPSLAIGMNLSQITEQMESARRADVAIRRKDFQNAYEANPMNFVPGRIASKLVADPKTMTQKAHQWIVDAYAKGVPLTQGADDYLSRHMTAQVAVLP